MPLISNGIKSKKVGKSGLDNRIYQPFYSFLEHFKKYAEINTEKVSLSIGPFLRKLVALFHLHFSASETDASKYKGKYYDSQIRRQQLNRKL